MGTPLCRRPASFRTKASEWDRPPCTPTLQRLLDLDLIEEAAGEKDADSQRRELPVDEERASAAGGGIGPRGGGGAQGQGDELEAGAGETMSATIYRLLLRLYPAEFRRRWEVEMVYTFELQLADGWWAAWWCALTDLPRRSVQGMVIPAVSIAGSGAFLFGLTWLLGNAFKLQLLYRHLIGKLGG